MKTESINGPVCPFCGKLDRQFAISHEKDSVIDKETFAITCIFCKRAYSTQICIQFSYTSTSTTGEYPDD